MNNAPSTLEPNSNALGPTLTWGFMVDALLKRPEALHQHEKGKGASHLTPRLLILSFAGMLAYGFIIGQFSGGQQLWVVPLKLAFGLLASATICWPSLYILVCLGGGQHTPAEVSRHLAGMLGLMSLLLVGFAPVAWIFTQSTGSAQFMGALHLLLWGTCCAFALRRLATSISWLGCTPIRTVAIWNIVFVVVCLQMATVLRPLVGPFDGWQLAPRKFFLEHWSGNDTVRSQRARH